MQPAKPPRQMKIADIVLLSVRKNALQSIATQALAQKPAKVPRAVTPPETPFSTGLRVTMDTGFV